MRQASGILSVIQGLGLRSVRYSCGGYGYGELGIVLGVVVRLPRPMEGNGVTPIFRSLQNCQFHHRRLESYVFNVNLTDSFDDRRSQCRLI